MAGKISDELKSVLRNENECEKLFELIAALKYCQEEFKRMGFSLETRKWMYMFFVKLGDELSDAADFFETEEFNNIIKNINLEEPNDEQQKTKE